MGREVILFSSEERTSRAHVANFLRELANKVDSGTVRLMSGTGDVDVDIPGDVVLEIKLEEEEKGTSMKRSLEVEIEWREGETARTGVSLG